MLFSENIIKRYTAPTSLDHRPFRTVWVYYKDNRERNIYVQVSSDIHKPHWVSFGKLLEIAFHHFFDNNQFMDLVVNLYINNDHDTLEKLKSVVLKHD